MLIALRRFVAVVVPLILLVGCDHATKFVAKAELEAREPRELIPSLLDLRYVENTDMAFNLLRFIPEQVRTPLLLLLGVGGVVLFASALFVLRSSMTKLNKLALLLVLSGALGNTIDRALRGYVVDFIHLRHWPVFNFADVWLSVGLALILLESLRAHRAAAAQIRLDQGLGPPPER